MSHIILCPVHELRPSPPSPVPSPPQRWASHNIYDTYYQIVVSVHEAPSVAGAVAGARCQVLRRGGHTHHVWHTYYQVAVFVHDIRLSPSPLSPVPSPPQWWASQPWLSYIVICPVHGLRPSPPSPVPSPPQRWAYRPRLLYRIPGPLHNL